DRLRPGQAGQRLVPVPRGQQPGQVLPKPAPLRQRREQVVEPGRVALQRPRRRRARTPRGHHRDHLPTQSPPPTGLPHIPPQVNKSPLRTGHGLHGLSRTLRTVLGVLVSRVRAASGPSGSCPWSGDAGAGFLTPWGAVSGLGGPMPRTIALVVWG